MKTWLVRSVFVGTLLTLAACAGPQGPGADGVDGAAEADAAARDAERRAGARFGDGFEGTPLDDPASPLSKRTIYFEFDSSEIRSEFQDIITAHAQYLAANPELSVVLEGHTDERGSREYNMALGERRASSVQKMMLLQGVQENQVQSVSFGEERPAAPGSDESAWQANRRVELLYPGH